MKTKTEKDMLDIYLHYVENFLANGGKKENLSSFDEYCEEFKKLHYGDHTCKNIFGDNSSVSDKNLQPKKSDLIEAQINIHRAELANLESRKAELNAFIADLEEEKALEIEKEVQEAKNKRNEIFINKQYDRHGLLTLVDFLHYVLTQNDNDGMFTLKIRD